MSIQGPLLAPEHVERTKRVNPLMSMRTLVYVNMCVYASVLKCMCEQECVNLYLHECVRGCVCVCVCACMCMCVWVCDACTIIFLCLVLYNSIVKAT